MKLKSSGKVLTIFLVIIAILLVTLTAFFAFFFQKEIERGKRLEGSAEEMSIKVATLEEKLKKAEKQTFVLEERNKEADERINTLLDEIELDEGIRNELKLEVASLKEKIDAITDEKVAIRKEISQQVLDADQKVIELESKIKVEQGRASELEKVNKELEIKVADLSKVIKVLKSKATGSYKNSSMDSTEDQASVKESEESDSVEKKSSVGIVLDPIVVMPGAKIEEIMPKDVADTKGSKGPSVAKAAEAAKAAAAEVVPIEVMPKEIPDGRILSVDVDTEFVIINLGEKDGITNGRILSVYRGEEFLGDVKVTRVQPEMSAADLVPPFSAQLVRKNDQVSIK